MEEKEPILIIIFINFISKIQFYIIRSYCHFINIPFNAEIDKLKIGTILIKFRKQKNDIPAKWYLIHYFKRK